MKANHCQLKVFVDASYAVVETQFCEWARGLPASANIEGQPSMWFSPALQKFVLSCLYEDILQGNV